MYACSGVMWHKARNLEPLEARRAGKDSSLEPSEEAGT